MKQCSCSNFHELSSEYHTLSNNGFQISNYTCIQVDFLPVSNLKCRCVNLLKTLLISRHIAYIFAVMKNFVLRAQQVRIEKGVVAGNIYNKSGDKCGL